MRVLVFGAHSPVGERVIIRLHQCGHEAVAVVGTEIQIELLEKQGATEVVLYDEYSEESFYQGKDAVIFLTGTSPKAHTDKTVLVDHQAVQKVVQAAEQFEVKRFVFMSAINANEEPLAKSREIAKKELPDDWIRKSKMTYTIFQPASLTDRIGKRMITTEPDIEEQQEISCDDMAEVLVASLTARETFNQTIAVAEGDTPIPEALSSI